MVSSRALTVKEYLASLPADRRAAIATVRKVVRAHLPSGFEETMQYGMITYVVPLATYPQGYLGKKDVPLPFVSLAAQKNHSALYLMNVYGNVELERWFRAAYAKSGKQLDMGKACVRFKSAGDLALDVIGEAIAKTPVRDYVDRYVATRGSAKKPKALAKKPAKTTAPAAHAKRKSRGS